MAEAGSRPPSSTIHVEDACSLSYERFVQEYMLPNQPVLIRVRKADHHESCSRIESLAATLLALPDASSSSRAPRTTGAFASDG